MRQRVFWVFAIVAGLAMGTSACSKAGNQPVATTLGSAGAASTPGTTILQSGTTFTADPNPIQGNGEPIAITTLSWTAKTQKTEVRVGSPAGKVFASGGASGRATTGKWVTNGMTFYLQDAFAGHPEEKTATLATLTVAVR